MKISIALWKHNQLKDGTYPLKIKVFDKNAKPKEKYHALDIYLKPNQWDATNKTVKNHSSTSIFLELLINCQRINLKQRKSSIRRTHSSITI